MKNAFSLYAERASGLHRLHPLTKLALSGLLLVGGLALPTAWAAYAAFVLVALPLALWGRITGPFLRALWPVVLPFAVSLLLVQGLFWPGGTPILSLWIVSFKREGVLYAVTITGHILLVISSFLLLSLATRPDALMTALVARGMPENIAYIVLTTLQIVPAFQAKAQTILDAQRSRGLETEGSLVTRLRALLPLVVPLVLGSIVDIEERAIALEARAFTRRGEKTSLLTLTDSLAQRTTRWGLGALMLGLIAVRVAGVL
jgi:energy-coupling factor transport system permease protein